MKRREQRSELKYFLYIIQYELVTEGGWTNRSGEESETIVSYGDIQGEIQASGWGLRT